MWPFIVSQVLKGVKTESTPVQAQGTQVTPTDYQDTPKQDWLKVATSLVSQQSKAMQEFQSNPLNMVAYKLGLKSAPNIASLLGADPLSKDQEMGLEYAKELMKPLQPSRGVVGNVVAKILKVDT